MRLIKFRVTGFRSVEDSGWVDTGAVTALIGTNESGKTNLLLPLWKLNPAKDGAIDPVPDYPRARFTDIRNSDKKPVFIRAVFEVEDELADDLIAITGVPREHIRLVEVTRNLGGGYTVSFPEAAPQRDLEVSRVYEVLDGANTEIARLEIGKSEEPLKALMLEKIGKVRGEIEADAVDAGEGIVDDQAITRARDILQDGIDLDKAPKRSAIAPHYAALLERIETMVAEVSVPHPNTNAKARTLVRERMPKFVYYSNYGNLDSEIYLPHVIENMKREGLGTKETAKARTLKVLFDFVGLSPEEILSLGREPQATAGRREPTVEEVQQAAEQKKERSVLLQSAGTKLTREFRDWWRQGEYRFRFQADGDHFRIWVSDDKRPEDIELESRSTGLQWFLSFYLIFLVERADAHEDAILLLDEPGMSLHPLAQRDLSEFFENLAKTSQILYTTHSPFLVDPDHLDRVKAVYVDDSGATAVSPDLRVTEAKGAQSRSIYPVYAALGLTVSDTLLQGCQVVVVEGTSDQHYLSAMKTLLISTGRIAPQRELIFVPAGGVRGVSAVVAITTGKDEVLPYALLDADGPGGKLAQQLKTGLYQGDVDRVLLADAFADNVGGAEVEDLLPPALIATEVRRIVRGPEEDFDEVMQPDKPIIDQIVSYAAKNGVDLEPGWKVELAKRVKARLLRQGATAIPVPALERWGILFDRLLT